METVLLGWPSEGPTLRLDYRRFSYAGKFVMSTTGKAVIREPAEDGTEPVDGADPLGEGSSDGADSFDDDVLAAVAFNSDRTDPKTLWLRYVTVREDLRGEGLGPRLCAFVADRAEACGYDRLKIAVNNPFAYEALYRAGFVYSGEETGLAELVLSHSLDDSSRGRSKRTYQSGFDRYRDRDLSADERAFLERKRGTSPPETV